MLTDKEQKIYEAIKVPSDDNPNKPEFPPENPHWPSTPTKRITVAGFSDVYLKDESVNPTGTHKDRMAWEMAVNYKHLLEAKKKGRVEELPQMSIISSGSAANAIQQMFGNYGLPNLKVLLDNNIDPEVIRSLQKIGCEIYKTDLSKHELSKRDILSLTENENGMDITSDDSLAPFDLFYDWMTYDILNQGADYVFVPYGTGHLFENIVNIAVREAKTRFFPDPRFKLGREEIRKCNFLGATVNDPESKADKLYSPHLPFIHFDTRWIQLSVAKGYIGEESNVYTIKEKYLTQAYKIAEQNHVVCEYSGIAGLALMLQMAEKLPKDKKMLIVNTGKTKYK